MGNGAKMDSLNAFASAKLLEIEKRHLTRHIIATDRTEPAVLYRHGKRYVSFSCNDYLNLTQDHRVKQAAMAAVERYGAGAGASRLITGDHSLLSELERRLARFKETEDCVLFGSGYLANLGIIPILAGRGDMILADALSHACIMAGTQLSTAHTHIFEHNNVEEVEAVLERQRPHYRHCLLVTDGVFSMDGDLAPVAELSALARKYNAWLMTDDAHGLGVIGQGRGIAFSDSGKIDVPLQMGTLSKALGSYGGYLCASKPVCELMRNRARTIVFTTGLPPSAAAAALAALDIVEGDPDYVRKPLRNAVLFCGLLNLPTPQSPVVPIILGTPQRALDASAQLAEAGFIVTAIRPPTVPEGTSRLRVAFSARHEESDIRRLASLVHPFLSETTSPPCQTLL
jgi:8-amino-7-oxononanoate synthase